MIHQTNNKNLFQRVLLTLFFSLLFVGLAGLTAGPIVPPDFLSGVAKGTEFCDDGTGAGERDKVRIPVSISISKTSFPFIIATVTTPGITISGSGYAFLKNKRSGVFVFDAAGSIIIGPPNDLTLSGKFKTNSAGEIVKLKGNFALQDRSGGPAGVCITTGKFRMKTDRNPPPIVVLN